MFENYSGEIGDIVSTGTVLLKEYYISKEKLFCLFHRNFFISYHSLYRIQNSNIFHAE